MGFFQVKLVGRLTILTQNKRYLDNNQKKYFATVDLVKLSN